MKTLLYFLTILIIFLSNSMFAADQCNLVSKGVRDCFQTCVANPSLVLDKSIAAFACNPKGKKSGTCSEYCSAKCNSIQNQCSSKNVPPVEDENNGKCVEGDCNNGEGKMQYPKGHVYIGSFKNGIFDGLGEFTSPNGTAYKGNFKKGKHHGYGEYQLDTGDIYKGEWAEDKWTKGTWTLTNGIIMSGTFLNGEMVLQGYGELTYPNGAIYKGNWVNGKQHGKGILYDPEGNIYQEGNWANGEFKTATKKK